MLGLDEAILLRMAATGTLWHPTALRLDAHYLTCGGERCGVQVLKGGRRATS